MATHTVDVGILGTGPGGYVAAIRAGRAHQEVRTAARRDYSKIWHGALRMLGARPRSDGAGVWLPPAPRPQSRAAHTLDGGAHAGSTAQEPEVNTDIQERSVLETGVVARVVTGVVARVVTGVVARVVVATAWGDPLFEMASLALFDEIERDDALLRGYAEERGAALVFDDVVRTRIALAQLYLYLIMWIEPAPRRFGWLKRVATRRYVGRFLARALRTLASGRGR